ASVSKSEEKPTDQAPPNMPAPVSQPNSGKKESQVAPVGEIEAEPSDDRAADGYRGGEDGDEAGAVNLLANKKDNAKNADPAPPPPTIVEESRLRGSLGKLGASGGGKNQRGLGSESSERLVPSSKVIASDGVSKKGKRKSTKIRRRVRKPQPVSPVARGRKLPCSDSASRGRAQRRVLWVSRLAGQANMLGHLNVYESAAASCEIKGWKDQRVFLQLLIERASNEQGISLLLAHFAGETEARNYLARGLLRRLVDPGLIAAVEEAMFGGGIDWQDIDRQLLLITDEDPAEVARQQLALIQAGLSRSPGDPQGERRMLKYLVAHDQLARALARGRRLREQGLMTPLLAQQLGELFARQGDDEQARRVYSEIVEFDPQSAASRRLLGDIFLRHGWFEHAYRQFTDLVSLAGEDQTAVIRVALAAAGAGRTDEARRILRKVASGEGRPGPEDPRRFARLHAAVLLAKLLIEAQAGDSKIPADSVARELGRLQLFDGPSTFTLLVWNDLGADLVLAPAPLPDEEAEAEKSGKKSSKAKTKQPKPTPVLNGDVIDGSNVGLFALQTSSGEPPGDMVIRHRGIPGDREVGYTKITIRWDGTKPEVSSTVGTVAVPKPVAKPKPAAKPGK
ncbi:MAG: tetratricopeptide repeat protein, partial [Nannocystaceae bacterium]